MIKLKKILLEHALDSKIASLESSLKSKYPELEELGMYMQSSNNAIYLSDLYVKDEYRGQGIGTKVMHDIVEFADSHKLPIVLIPEPESIKKSAVAKLVDFYKKFGFVINAGKQIDYSLRLPMATSMYRLPKSS
jgi:GNAT superfamily N-acetyltransferase